MELDIEDIRRLCTEQSFERGVRYFEEGRVNIVDATSSSVEALVEGADVYKVNINIGGDIDATCNCPYDWGGYCKHIVATYLAMIEDHDKLEEIIKLHESEVKKVDSLLASADSEDLKNFLRQELERSQDLRSRFIICFSEKGEGKSLYDYKRDVSLLYRDVADRYGYVDSRTNIGFSSVEDLAKLYVEKGDLLEGAKIYRALFETISENMDYVDDSDSYYDEAFSTYLEMFAECIRDEKLDLKDKKKYIKYLFDQYVEDNSDYYHGEDYYRALEIICTSEEDLTYWLELLEPHIPKDLPDRQDRWSGYHMGDSFISMKLAILSKLSDSDEFYKLINEYYTKNPHFCIMYARRLRDDGMTARAIEVAEEGLDIFEENSTLSLRTFLNDLYKETDAEKYRENLIVIFYKERNWDHYDELKRISSADEWRILLNEMLKYFAEKSYLNNIIIEIYLRERMYGDAIKMVIESKDLAVLRRYHKELSGLYPQEYFRAYKELIVPFLDGKTGRDHYRVVVSHLKKMNEIEGFESEFEELIREMKVRHYRRPAFIDEMKVFDRLHR